MPRAARGISYAVLRSLLILSTVILCHCQSWEGFDKPAATQSGASAANACTGPIASISVTAGGTNFTALPTITAVGSGSGATFSSLLTATTVASYTVSTAGSGFTGPAFSGSISVTGGGGSGAVEGAGKLNSRDEEGMTGPRLGFCFV